MEEYFIAIITTVLGLALLFALRILLSAASKRNAFDFEVSVDENGKMGRSLGCLEKAFSSSPAKDGSGNDTTVLLLTSDVSLEPALVKRALLLVQARFPLLRMRVQFLSKMFLEMEDYQRVDFKTLDDCDAREWINAFEEDSRLSFDMERGPLWRASLLREHFDGVRYENSVIVTFHHMVCDGASVMTFYKTFLKYLNDLHQGKVVNVESMNLSPPIDTFIASKLHANLWKKCLLKLFPILMQIKYLFVKPDLNVYLAAFPPPILHNRSIVKRTSVIPAVLRKDEVSELIKLGKNHGCTFHSIITAATRLAMAQFLKSSARNQITSDLVNFKNSFNISLRNDAQPPIPLEEFGLFISVATMDIPSPSVQVTSSMFWSFAKQCHDLIRQIAVNSDDRFQLPLLVINADLERFKMLVERSTDGANCGRFPVAFNISNRGRFAIGQSEDVFQFAGTYFAMSEHSTGPPFGTNIVSVNGALYWGLIYFPNVATKQQAEKFLELTLEILRVAASSTEHAQDCGEQVTH